MRNRRFMLKVNEFIKFKNAVKFKFLNFQVNLRKKSHYPKFSHLKFTYLRNGDSPTIKTSLAVQNRMAHFGNSLYFFTAISLQFNSQRRRWHKLHKRQEHSTHSTRIHNKHGNESKRVYNREKQLKEAMYERVHCCVC